MGDKIRMTVDSDAVVLDPTDEFERVLIEMTNMNRIKSTMYGARGDKMANFYNVAKAEGITPLQAVSALGAKHRSVKREIIWGGRNGYDNAGDDAFIDDCVYAVLAKMMYDRERLVIEIVNG
jgi:xylose isomerase